MSTFFVQASDGQALQEDPRSLLEVWQALFPPLEQALCQLRLPSHKYPLLPLGPQGPAPQDHWHWPHEVLQARPASQCTIHYHARGGNQTIRVKMQRIMSSNVVKSTLTCRSLLYLITLSEGFEILQQLCNIIVNLRMQIVLLRFGGTTGVGKYYNYCLEVFGHRTGKKGQKIVAAKRNNQFDSQRWVWL